MLAEKAQSLLSFYQSTVGSGFSSTILKHSRVVSAGEDHRRVVVEFVVPILPDFSNISGAMHGGAIATIVDELTGVAVWLADHEPRHMATTNLSLYYLSAASAGEELRVVCRCDKVGRNIAFASAKLFIGDRIVASGRHALAISEKKVFQEESKL